MEGDMEGDMESNGKNNIGRRKVLVIGKSGFIGSSLAQWLGEEGYEVFLVSGRREEWKSFDMAGIDTVVYTAGLAHTKEKKGSEELFLKANVWQAVESAKKAKLSGVPQYIYISSMNVYGSAGKRIGADTPVKPDSLYGRSKRQGEQRILELESEQLAVAVIRPPVVSGAGCKGSIRLLAKASKYIPFFPDYPNQRSMIDIINLCSFISCLIDSNARGIYHPQNKEYISTYQLLSLMAHSRGRTIRPVSFLNPLIAWMIPRVKLLRKIFGDDCYDRAMSEYNNCSYWIRGYRESIHDMVSNVRE
ncbi:MAG TPA: NAD-dependent epimerase/dehydratase family protein [Clostridiales bacterium]|nr:NAD-dependent epimerase/dehydratase family protein [Clostridiales bacterium]